MHPNPTYRNTPEARSVAFARERGFGILAVSTEGAPVMAHVPFLLSEDASSARLHLVRSNPICRMVGDGIAARIAVSGPDAYISPDWYGVDDQVPTWNYVAVHLLGTLHALPPETMEEMLVDQSAGFEGPLDKAPWTMDKMTDEAKHKMMRMILPYRFEISEMQSTWKLGQNKPDDVRMRAAEQVVHGHGMELAALGALMAAPPDPKP